MINLKKSLFNIQSFILVWFFSSFFLYAKSSVSNLQLNDNNNILLMKFNPYSVVSGVNQIPNLPTSLDSKDGLKTHKNIKNLLTNKLPTENILPNHLFNTPRFFLSDSLINKTASFITSGNLMLPIRIINNTLLFTQVGYQRNNDTLKQNNFFTTGLGYRWLYHNHMIGINTLIDFNNTYRYNRASVGIEYWSSYMKFSGNYYFSTSQWENEKLNNNTLIRPAKGFDLKLIGILPAHPQLSTSISYERFFGEQVYISKNKNPYTLKVNVRYTPAPLFSFNINMYTTKINKPSLELAITLNYRFGIPLKQQLSFSSFASDQYLESHWLDLIERNQKIAIEYKNKPPTQTPSTTTTSPSSTNVVAGGNGSTNGGTGTGGTAKTKQTSSTKTTSSSSSSSSTNGGAGGANNGSKQSTNGALGTGSSQSTVVAGGTGSKQSTNGGTGTGGTAKTKQTSSTKTTSSSSSSTNGGAGGANNGSKQSTNGALGTGSSQSTVVAGGTGSKQSTNGGTGTGGTAKTKQTSSTKTTSSSSSSTNGGAGGANNGSKQSTNGALGTGSSQSTVVAGGTGSKQSTNGGTGTGGTAKTKPKKVTSTKVTSTKATTSNIPSNSAGSSGSSQSTVGAAKSTPTIITTPSTNGVNAKATPKKVTPKQNTTSPSSTNVVAGGAGGTGGDESNKCPYVDQTSCEQHCKNTKNKNDKDQSFDKFNSSITTKECCECKEACSTLGNCDLECGMMGYKVNPKTGCVLCECEPD